MKYVELDGYSVKGVYSYKPTGITTIEVDDSVIVTAGMLYIDGVFYNVPYGSSAADYAELSVDDAKAKLLDDQSKARANYLFDRLIQFCDSKTKEIESYVNGYLLSDEQIFRYRVKYDVAKAYKEDGSYEDLLKFEADIDGQTVDDFADMIISMGDEYNEKVRELMMYLEAFRVRLKIKILSNELDYVEQMISLAEAYNFGTMTSDDLVNKFLS